MTNTADKINKNPRKPLTLIPLLTADMTEFNPDSAIPNYAVESRLLENEAGVH